MINGSRTHVIDELLNTVYSTTLYLETLRREKLNVKVISQKETDTVITRISKLFFFDEKKPLLYCVSHLRRKLLLPDEYRMIKEIDLPLGSIFSQLHYPSVIFKKNLQVTEAAFSKVSAEMNLGDGNLYCKSYSFLIGVREVARIEEFFNQESLDRI
jgi:chorismate-pyruvate lyase